MQVFTDKSSSTEEHGRVNNRKHNDNDEDIYNDDFGDCNAVNDDLMFL